MASSFDPSRGRRPIKIDARGVDEIVFGEDVIDLRGLEQLVDASQVRAIGHAIWRASQFHMDGRRILSEVLDGIERELDDRGLDVLNPFQRGDYHPGCFARPRRFEVAAAINRLRSVRITCA